MRELDFLIVGHARGGTGYMAALMRSIGFDVKHERLGEHGVSAWVYAVDDERYPHTRVLPPRSSIKFKKMIHVIRNPLDTINSAFNTDHKLPESVDFRDRHLRSIGIRLSSKRLESTVQSVLGWHELIRRQNPDMTIKIETVPHPGFFQDLSRMGYLATRVSPYPPQNFNTRPKEGWKIFSWQLLKKRIPSSLYTELHWFARNHGYVPW